MLWSNFNIDQLRDIYIYIYIYFRAHEKCFEFNGHKNLALNLVRRSLSIECFIVFHLSFFTYRNWYLAQGRIADCSDIQRNRDV